MSTPSGFRLACLDMAGTLVSDDGVVLQAFQSALASSGAGYGALAEPMQYARETMGQAKSEVFAHLLGDPQAVSAAMEAFDASVGEAIEAGFVTALPGATEAIAELRSDGLAVCLTTGFSARLQERLLAHLGWRDLVDFWLAPGDGLRGRPFPDMVLVAALRTKVDDVRQVAVAGDTASDLWSGWRAGAGVVAGVLTGSHSRRELEAAPHTHIIPSIADFPALVA